jgi:hypothetical protein
MMENHFRAKTWIFWAQCAVFGGLGLFSVSFGILFWTGAMTDALGKTRPDAGPPMLVTGSGMLAVAVLAVFKILGRVAPVIRCYREGVMCNLVGATSLDGIPLLPGLIRVAWAIISIQGFRSQRVCVAWPEFSEAKVGGIPMAHVLKLSGKFMNLKNEQITRSITFSQASLLDHPRLIASTLNEMAANPTQRDSLPSWTATLT